MSADILRRSSRTWPRFSLAIALAAVLVASPLRAEVIERVLAVAAGEMIMLSDVIAATELGLVSPGAAADPVLAVLNVLIDRELILAEVERYAPPEPSAEAVDAELQRVRARVPSARAYEAVLQRCGIDEKRLRETLREDLRIAAYQDQRFVVPAPTEDELGRYYREHPETFTRGGQVMSFEGARPDVVRAWTAERRRTLVGDWVAGLRRRGDVIDLYLAAKGTP